MRKTLPLVLSTLFLAACAGAGSALAPAHGDPSSQSATVNSNGTLTVSGKILGIASSGEFEIQAGTGCGSLNIYTSSSTAISPSGAKPAVGDIATATGTGSCATSLNASSVTLTSTASSPATTVSGTILGIVSPTEFEIQAGTGCGSLNIYTTASTAISPSGAKPAVGDIATATGTGSCATSFAAASVTLSAPAPAATATPTSPPSHIEVIVMENYAYSSVIGSSATPYINSMAQTHLLFTNSHAITHPSEPNYLALFAGTTEGLTSDACPVSYDGPTLASELAAAGRTFALFAQDLPSNNSTVCNAAPSSSVASGYLYWRKHNPAADFPFLTSAETQPWTGTATSAYGAADVSFIIPNICNDMHDCGVAAGDAWASANVPAIESFNAAHNGLLILTFDEAEYDSSNHIVTIFDGMGLHGTSTQYIDHYAVLRYIEDAFGAPYAGNSASATPIVP